MKPKLISLSIQNNIEIAVWRNPPNMKQKDVDCYINYCKNRAKELSMTLRRYVEEFE